LSDTRGASRRKDYSKSAEGETRVFSAPPCAGRPQHCRSSRCYDFQGDIDLVLHLIGGPLPPGWKHENIFQRINVDRTEAYYEVAWWSSPRAARCARELLCVRTRSNHIDPFQTISLELAVRHVLNDLDPVELAHRHRYPFGRSHRSLKHRVSSDWLAYDGAKSGHYNLAATQSARREGILCPTGRDRQARAEVIYSHIGGVIISVTVTIDVTVKCGFVVVK
jgi:hypothetical protein